MREKLEDDNVYFYYKDDITNIIKGMWKLESTIMINTNLIIQGLKFTESLFSNNQKLIHISRNTVSGVSTTKVQQA